MAEHQKRLRNGVPGATGNGDYCCGWEVPDYPPLEELREREWTRADTTPVLRLYERGTPVYELEAACRIELRQIVIRLVRLMFGVKGYLDDEDTAVNSGETCTEEDLALMRTMHVQCSSLHAIAAALGRTPLGAGWKLLSLGIATIPEPLRREHLAP